MAGARIAVTTPSFARLPDLRAALDRLFDDVRYCPADQRIGEGAMADFLADRDAVIVGLERVDGPLLDRLPGLRMVAKYGVGLDNIDLDALKARGVALGWTPGVNRRSVSELALGYMLGHSRHIFRSIASMKAGIWDKRGGVQLTGRTVGIIGLGHVGCDLAALLRPFGCRILANDVIDRRAVAADLGVVLVDKETIWREADIISLHVPLTEVTRGLVGASELAAMKPDALLINTARGGIIDHDALATALRGGRIAGAAIDVFPEEPETDRAFLDLPTLYPTPHIGGAAREAILAMGLSAVDHLKRFFADKPDPITP